MALASLSPLSTKTLKPSISPTHSTLRSPLKTLSFRSRSAVCELSEGSNPNPWRAMVSAALAAATATAITFCGGGPMPALADLNKFEAEQRGEFGIGSAAQFGSADLRKAVHVNENFRRANFTSADMRESDFSGSTFNGAYLEKAVAYKANFTGGGGGGASGLAREVARGLAREAAREGGGGGGSRAGEGGGGSRAGEGGGWRGRSRAGEVAGWRGRRWRGRRLAREVARSRAAREALASGEGGSESGRWRLLVRLCKSKWRKKEHHEVLNEANFTNAVLVRSVLTRTRSDLGGAKIEGADFSDAVLICPRSRLCASMLMEQIYYWCEHTSKSGLRKQPPKCLWKPVFAFTQCSTEETAQSGWFL